MPDILSLEGFTFRDANAHARIDATNTKVEATNTKVEAIEKMLANGVGAKGLVSVMDYGAKGDGVTDDTAAIKQAIAENSGTIIFPYGTYLISETIELPQSKFSSLLFLNAIIKQSVALSPMILVGSDDGANYPISVSGNGVIQMDGLGGIGIQISNHAGYSHVDEVQVRGCSNGIGVLIGSSVDGEKTSLQCQLNNVKIYGNDSRNEGVGLYVNAWDCMFNNLYLYLCKTGGIVKGGNHTFVNTHIWCHSYEDWTNGEYAQTVGLDVYGECHFNFLYIDSTYNGLKTNGYNQYIDTLTYQNDISNEFVGEVTVNVISKPEAGRVIVNGAALSDPINRNFNVKVFNVEGATTATQQAADERCIIQHGNLGSCYDILDESNNMCLQKTGKRLIIPSSPCIKNKYYLVGYIKGVADVLKLNLYRKYGFNVELTIRVDAGNVTNIACKVLEANMTDITHFYYGAAIEKYGVKWIPVYLKYDANSSYFTLYAKGENYGENGFFPCSCTKMEELKMYDAIDATEINITG